MTEPTRADGRDLRSRSIIAVGWTVLRTWYLRLASLLAIVVLARVLTPTEFGTIALASVFVTIATTFSDVGLTPSLIRSQDRSASQLNTAFWTGIGISTVLFLGLQIFAAPIAQFYAQPILEAVVRWLALILPLSALSSVPTAVLTRDLQMKPLAVRQMVGTSIGTAGAVVIALVGGGVWSLVFQALCPAAVGVVILWRSVSWRPRFQFRPDQAKALLAMGGPILGSQLVHQLRDRGTELLIGSLLGAPSLGYWVVAGRIVRVVMDLFTAVVNSISLPAFAATVSDRARFARGVRYAIRMSTLSSMPIFIGLAVVSPTLIPLVFGSQWATTGAVAQIVVITAALSTVQWIDSNVWWALGRPTVELMLTLIISAVHVGVVFVVAPYGLVPLAWAILIRTIALMALRMVALVKIGGVPLNVYRDVPALVLSSALAALATLGVGTLIGTSRPWVYLIADGLVMLAVFVALLWFVQRSTLVEVFADVRRLRRRRANA